MAIDPNAWWREGVFYEIYPRSFADSNGDGVGDLAGIVDHLDHLQWLGVTGLWLNPVTVSPNADWGYDVSDYCDVDPALGTLADLDRLVAEAQRRGIRVLLDLVPNHTSDRHPWFVEARRSRDAATRDYYVWADGRGDDPPNNWVSTFGGTAWTRDEATGQYFLHNFLPEQPDLNWWSPNVRDEFDRILRFWFDRGVMGFRIDVVHMVVKDAELRDNPPATEQDPFGWQIMGQRPEFNSCRSEGHDVIRRWRTVADGYSPTRILVGETHVQDPAVLASFYGRDDELHLAFNFILLECPWEAAKLRGVIERTEAALGPDAWPVWTGGNHDVSRFPTRWAEGDPMQARVALMMLLTLRGTPFLYYGDEIGMVDTEIAREQVLDPVGERFWPYYKGRDPERTPMAWSTERDLGFGSGDAAPWLPFGPNASNVTAQRHDPDSMLSLCRDLIGLRAAIPELRTGAYTSVDAPEGVLAYRRGERVVVVLGLAPDGGRVRLDGIHGEVRIGTRRELDGDRVDGELPVSAGDGLVVWLDG